MIQLILIEPAQEKTCLPGFRPSLSQTGRGLEAGIISDLEAGNSRSKK